MTENKRYFKRMWEEEYYIFDSETISEKEFDEKVEYEDYRAFEDSMQGDEVVNRLNGLDGTIKDLSDDYEQLLKENKELKADNKRMVKFIMSKGYGLKDYLDFCKEYKE